MERRCLSWTKGLVLVLAASALLLGCSAKKENVVIKFWDMLDGPADVYQATAKALCQQYTAANPGVTVDYQSIPWDNFYQTFLTAVKSGAAPDVSTGGFGMHEVFARMGETLDLDSIVDQYKKESTITDFPPGFMELHTYNGHQVGIPYMSAIFAYYYRKDMFEKAGITKLPETWAEFIDAGRAIKKKLGIPFFAVNLADAQGNNYMLSLLLANGTGVVDKDMKPLLAEKNAIETYQYLMQMYKEGLVPKGMAAYKTADVQKAYEGGKIAVFTTYIPTFNDPNIAKETAVLPVMQGPSGTKGDLTWVNMIGGFKQTKHPDAVKKFIKWYADNCYPLFTDGKAGGFPARKSFITKFESVDDPIIKGIAQEDAGYMRPPVYPVTSLYPKFGQIDGENLLAQLGQMIFTGETDAAKVGQHGNDLVTKALSE